MIAATVIFPPTHPVWGHFAPIAAYRASHALAEFRLWVLPIAPHKKLAAKRQLTKMCATIDWPI
jgi:hypothetical protein